MISSLPTWMFLAPFLTALFIAALGWWIRGSARVLALCGLAATTLLAFVAAVRVFAEGTLISHVGNWAPPIGIELLIDPLAALMAVLVSATAFIVLSGSTQAMRRELEGRDTSFYALALLLTAGMLGMVVTGDLFNLFVQLEVASLSAYALVAAGRRGAPRAALNYLLIGSLGASLYLTGVGFLYAATGSLNMADIAARLSLGPLALTGAIFIAVGLSIKMALFPVHGWMPSAYATAPSPSAALMAPLVTKVAAYALIRVFFWVYTPDGFKTDASLGLLLDLLGWAGAAAVIAGGVFAFMQKDLARMLAYSSVSQVGIIAIGISLANRDGLTGAILHIANDTLMKAALFLALGGALTHFGVRRVDQLGILRGRAPWIIAIIAVAGISLIGLPPFAGFFGKWYVLLGALHAGRWDYVAAIIAGTLVTAAYVFRVMEPLMFAGATAGSTVTAHGVPAEREAIPTPPKIQAAVIAGLVFAFFIILLGVFNAPVVDLVRAALPEGL